MKGSRCGTGMCSQPSTWWAVSPKTGALIAWRCAEHSAEALSLFRGNEMDYRVMSQDEWLVASVLED